MGQACRLRNSALTAAERGDEMAALAASIKAMMRAACRSDIDASGRLEHSVRCAVHAHAQWNTGIAVCSCEVNQLQERINKAQEP
jgi:hypothetical protein